MKQRIVKILLLLTIVLSPIYTETISSDYEPLTRLEATNWLKSITMDELVDFVIKYDYIEHTTFTINPPISYLAILDKSGDLHISTVKDTYLLTLGDLSTGQLTYSVQFSSQTIEDFYKEKKPILTYISIGAISLSVGLLLGLLL